MKKIVFLLMSIFFSPSYGFPLPTTWSKYLTSTEECKETSSFWQLQGSPFAYLKFDSGRDIPMHQVELDDCQSFDCLRNKVYRSIPSGTDLSELQLPTFEIIIPSAQMSILPRIVISYSGIQQTCFMSYIDDRQHSNLDCLSKFSSSDVNINCDEFDNVGSIGH